MKRKLAFLTVLFCLISGAYAGETNDPKITQERVDKLEIRVHEIWKMDFREMDNVEKAALRDEVKNIQKELKVAKRMDTVTLSVGAIIIILLLLILLT